jgi:hypothetical protein
MSPAKRIVPDYDKASSELFNDLVSQLQYGNSRAHSVSLVWNLLHVLNLEDDDETMQQCLQKWESQGILEFVLAHRVKAR